MVWWEVGWKEDFADSRIGLLIANGDGGCVVEKIYF